MPQRKLRVGECALLDSAIEGHFGGRVTMARCDAIQFDATDEGSGQVVLSQIADFNGGDAQARHEAGWKWTLARFEADIAEHGSVWFQGGLVGNVGE